MKKVHYYFLGTILLFLVASRFFVYASDINEDMSLEDDKYQKEFNMKYGIFSIVKPESLEFAGEKVPIQSSEIWERLDNELLRNVYFQSNTTLYFKKANKYFPIIEPILKQYEIPEDFKYLAVIESGLENVVSPSGAAGFWQIMKATAREYGLEVNADIDERYHLEKATIAACKYLKEAYNQFGNWTVAAASYNMGRSGISKRMQEQDVSNYYNLFLNSETARYVFRIIAIKEILENPKDYGFIFRERDLYNMPTFKVIEVDSTIDNLYDFSRSLRINYKLLKYFNPWLRSTSLPDESRKRYKLRVPVASSLITLEENDLE